MKYKVLITDDDPSLLAIYRALLATMHDVEADFASTPGVCRDYLRTGFYDMVLLDIYLSPEGPDGLDILDEITTSDPSANVIMMSTCDGREMVDTCNDLGAAQFISKNKNFLPSFAKCILDKKVLSEPAGYHDAAVVNF